MLPFMVCKIEFVNLVGSHSVHESAEYYHRGSLIEAASMLVSRLGHLTSLLYKLPSPRFEVKTIHLVIAIAGVFAAAVDIKLIIVN